MSRLIDADALTDKLESLCDTVCQYSKAQRSVMCGACPLGGAFDVVEDASTVSPDMAQVLAYECGKAERKRGMWHYCDTMYYCDSCGSGFYEMSAFCPNCGADMRVEANDAICSK